MRLSPADHYFEDKLARPALPACVRVGVTDDFTQLKNHCGLSCILRYEMARALVGLRALLLEKGYYYFFICLEYGYVMT